MVGRAHRCIPIPRDVAVERTNSAEQPAEPRVESLELRPGRGTYRYRDPDKWRAYMREYMRSKRAKLKAT